MSNVMLNREGGRNPNLGFGMIPPKPRTMERYLCACKSLEALLFGAEPDARTLDAISEVKGICNRVLREDQPDWVVVWLRLGLPNKRRLMWIVGDFVVLRNALKEGNQGLAKTVADRLLWAGLGTALKFFVQDIEIPPEDGVGYLYILSTRSDPSLLKIGQTQRHVLKRVEEINRATGVVEPFSPRKVWHVNDPVAVERAVHNHLKEHRVRVDREFFRLEVGQASKGINDVMQEMGASRRLRGHVARVLSDRNYGFIKSDGCDFFFHRSELQGLEFQALDVGTEVTFDRLDTRFGLAASDIQGSDH